MRNETAALNVVALPGLDGTGRLFDRFIAAAPAGIRVVPVALPPDRVLSYRELSELIRSSLPPGPLIVLGESFSGPLAVRLATAVDVTALVLCASFVRAPFLERLVATPLSFLLRSAPPMSVVRALLTGGDEALARDLVRSVATVDRNVLASRIRMVLEVDAAADLEACSAPVLYLRATRDRLVGAHQAELVRRVQPDAHIAEIDGPHLLLQTKPDECWSRILSEELIE